MERSPEMQKALDSCSDKVFGPTKAGECVTCKKSIGEFRDALSKKEFGISGMCQACQDSVFDSEEET